MYRFIEYCCLESLFFVNCYDYHLQGAKKMGDHLDVDLVVGVILMCVYHPPDADLVSVHLEYFGCHFQLPSQKK